jgi:hypothetical protein
MWTVRGFFDDGSLSFDSVDESLSLAAVPADAIFPCFGERNARR